MCRSSKSVLPSLLKNYDVLINSQILWRTDIEQKWSTDARKSSLVGNAALLPAAKVIKLLGRQQLVVLSQRLFKLLQDQWASYNPLFRTFRDNYDKYYKAEKKKPHPNVVLFRNWKVDQNTEEQKQWQKMNKKAWEVGRVLLDGVYFRSQKVQRHKGTKTDNSCITGEVNIDQRTSIRQRNVTVTSETCYGKIETFYLHFMYPPSDEQLRAATTKSKLDPSKINIPFVIVAHCDWFVPIATGFHAGTGLPQITPYNNWNTDCPLIRMQDCWAANVAFWPVNPIRKYRNLLTKMFVEDASSDEDDECKEAEESDPYEHDYLVISHHEKVPVILRNR